MPFGPTVTPFCGVTTTDVGPEPELESSQPTPMTRTSAAAPMPTFAEVSSFLKNAMGEVARGAVVACGT